LEREQHLSFLEFNYMLMQAFDFVELYKNYGCTLQVSGADQWGNVVNGIELGRKKLKTSLAWPDSFVADDCRWQEDGQVRRQRPVAQSRDAKRLRVLPILAQRRRWSMVEKMLKLFTVLPMDEVKRLSALKDAEINEAKKILAFEATKMMRGSDAAEKSAATALETFAGGGRGADLPKINCLRAIHYPSSNCWCVPSWHHPKARRAA
jgi:tyrosyl-tRNA synthetase